MPSDLRDGLYAAVHDHVMNGKIITTQDRHSFEMGWLACAKHLEEAVKDAERYRAIRVLGREWSNMRVFDYKGALEPQALDKEADALIAATKGENNA